MNEILLPRLDRPDLWQYLTAVRKPILLYGMGNGADKLIERLANYGVAVADVFASDAFVRGQSFHGKTVLTYAQACKKYEDFIVLVAFASRLPEVLSNIQNIARERELYIPDIPVVGEEYFTAAFYQTYFSEIAEAYTGLEDEVSRTLLSSVLEMKLFGTAEAILSHAQTREEEFALFAADKITHMVDAGAYNGDTIRAFANFFPNLSMVIAVEPDRKTFTKLQSYARSETRFSVLPVHAAVWEHTGDCTIPESHNRNTSLLRASYQNKEAEVSLCTVDALLSGEAVELIKYDVEGAEHEALRGSAETIRRHRPVLLISAYHRSEDLFSLLKEVKQICSEYRFYLRKMQCVPAWEIDLIAVPK